MPLTAAQLFGVALKVRAAVGGREDGEERADALKELLRECGKFLKRLQGLA